jgi:1-phosphatidylinositol-3-phosphate 5-kinase
MLVRPHSKVVLREAIKSDSEFLSKSNIMDYSYVILVSPSTNERSYNCSLLLGVDEERKQIACGVVDTIGVYQSSTTYSLLVLIVPSASSGSYTFAKTLEYKAKQGLQAGKDVTVIPPAEYRERFVNALDRYFLACPGECLSN